MKLVSLNSDLQATLTLVRNLMQDAHEVSRNSKSTRRKVGAILVDGNNDKITDGFNCIHSSFGDSLEDESGKTKPEVIHAEQAILYKIGANRSAETSLFVTTCPCKECAALITMYTRIYTVCFSETYRNLDGLELLLKDGLVNCLYYSEEQETLYKIERIENGLFTGHKLAGKGTMTITMGPYDPLNPLVDPVPLNRENADLEAKAEADFMVLTLGSQYEDNELSSVHIIND